MRLKNNSVQVQGIRPELIIALIIANEVYAYHGLEFVITSVTDGKHSKTSLHYSGCAFDCRIYSTADSEAIRDEIKRQLNIDYDVILEKNHIHIEFQPRRRSFIIGR